MFGLMFTKLEYMKFCLERLKEADKFEMKQVTTLTAQKLDFFRYPLEF